MEEKIGKRRDFLINIAYFATIFLIVYLVFKYALKLIMPFLVAFILVAIFAPLARWLNKKVKIKTGVLTFVIMLLVFILVGTLLFLLVLQIINWAQQLYYYLPDYYYQTIKPGFMAIWEDFQNLLGQMPPSISRSIGSFQSSLENSFDKLIEAASATGLNQVKRFTTAIPSFLLAFVFTILLSFFISLQYDTIAAFLRRQIPDHIEGYIEDFREIVLVSLGKYVRALLILMSITFVELAIGLFILRVPYSVLVAAGIAILDALPVFGTGTVLIPWAVIRLFQGDFRMAIGLLIIYGVISLVRNIIEPKVVGDKLGLNPVVSLVSIYLGYKLFGVFGMIIMPITIQILIELHKRGTIQLFRDKTNEPEPLDEQEHATVGPSDEKE